MHGHHRESDVEDHAHQRLRAQVAAAAGEEQGAGHNQIPWSDHSAQQGVTGLLDETRHRPEDQQRQQRGFQQAVKGEEMEFATQGLVGLGAVDGVVWCGESARQAGRLAVWMGRV